MLNVPTNAYFSKNESMKIRYLCLLCFFAIGTNAQCYQDVRVNTITTIGLRTDGTLWSWGSNSWGVLGQGIVNTVGTYPMGQIGTGQDWNKLSNVTEHALAIKIDGTLWAWGKNADGQCGVGTMGLQEYFTAPQLVSTDSWTSVSVGNYHSLGVKADGTLWSWGSNESGQLGFGTMSINYALVPTQVGTESNWAKVFTYSRNSFAIKTDGTLWSWGLANPVLGYQSTSSTSNLSPHQIGNDSWLTISSSVAESVLGIKTDGTLWGWGRNSLPEPNVQFYGNGYPDTNVYTNGPIQIGTDSDWAQVCHYGQYATFLTKTDGTLWAHGRNTSGMLGTGTTLPVYAPVQLGTDTDWLTVDFCTAVKQNGSLYQWGATNPVISLVGTACTLNTPEFDSRFFAAYPNPVTDWLTIYGNFNGKAKISVYDVLGKIFTCENTVHANTCSVNLSDLATGTYFVTLNDGQNRGTLKIVKQ
jgi:hypothetical protein